MDKIIDIAKYIVSKYKQITGDNITELKLHKLLYLCQRENYAILNEPMFIEHFEGWRHGPVNVEVREHFSDGSLVGKSYNTSDTAIYIVNNVIDQYGNMDVQDLSELTHKELSWINSRNGLSPEDNGTNILKEEDIKHDAEKVRPFDSLWGMYYDEFDDAEEGVDF